METKTIIDTIFAAIGGFLAYVYGPLDTMLIVLLVFIVTDYITGVINAAVHKRVSSEVGFKGLLQKVLIFVVVGVGALLDRLLPDLNGALRVAVAMFYIANEGISILENAGAIGLPLPAKLLSILTQLKEKSESADEE